MQRITFEYVNQQTGNKVTDVLEVKEQEDLSLYEWDFNYYFRILSGFSSIFNNGDTVMATIGEKKIKITVNVDLDMYFGFECKEVSE